MKRISIRTAAPLVLLLGIVAGCGSTSKASQPNSPATPQASTSPQNTPTPIPTLVVTGGDTAAVVNGAKVPMSTFRSLLALAQRQSTGTPGVTTKVLAKDTMNAIIADELVRQYATAHGLGVANAEVTARIARDVRNFGGRTALDTKLAGFGLTYDSYSSLVRSSIERHKVATKVTPLHAAHVRHILIATTSHKPPRTDATAHALASQLLARVQHGGNFVALAHQYSDDPGSGKLGGDLGTFCTGLGLMVAPFDQASASLPPHRPTIVHTQFGYHIIEVLGRGLAKPGQCTPPPGSPPGTPTPQAENTKAFQNWVTARIQQAKIQRIAHVT